MPRDKPDKPKPKLAGPSKPGPKPTGRTRRTTILLNPALLEELARGITPRKLSAYIEAALREKLERERAGGAGVKNNY
mgnify:CR=1 FL=1